MKIKKTIIGSSQWGGEYINEYNNKNDVMETEKITATEMEELLTKGYVTTKRKHGLYMVQFKLI